MTNEKIDIAQNIIKPPVWDREREEDLLATLEAIPEENIMKMWAKMDEAEAKRREEEKKEEIPQELKDFRKKWEEKIDLDEDKKKVIIEAAKSIPVKVETESDGSRLIEFKLWWKKWKILDPKLKTHSDDEYKSNPNYDSIIHIDDGVLLGWMKWDDVNQRKNKKLAKYVKKKEKEWLHIAKIEEMKTILTEIWESAGLDGWSDQIAMLMYLTGMDWWYRLSMWDDKTSGSQGSRSLLRCLDYSRGFNFYDNDGNYASLCLIACEK